MYKLAFRVALFSACASIAFPISLTVTDRPATCGRYDVYELTLKVSGRHSNPWQDVTIAAQFRSPDGRGYRVGGFYYEGHLWKVRFAPSQTGEWKWSVMLQAGSEQASAEGNFQSVPSTNPGFLRVFPANPYRLMTEGDGRPFYPIGFSEHPGDWTGRGRRPDGLLDWCMGADPPRCDVGSDEYLGTYAAAGNNLFRYNAETMNDLEQFNVGGKGRNTYRTDIGKLKDRLAVALKQYHMKALWVFLAKPDNYVRNWDLSDPQKTEALIRYHQYAIDRWGAYVDIWELMNEGSQVPRRYYEILIAAIRARDPYQHPVTTSYQPWKPEPLLDIISPHRYYSVPNTELDHEFLEGRYDVNAVKKVHPNKPMILGEVGNKKPVGNYDPERYRILLWSAFFNQVSVLFWNTSYTKDYHAGLSNMYIGTEERQISSIHAKFIADFDPASRPLRTALEPSGEMRAYVLGTNQEIGAYLLHATSHTATLSGGKMTLEIPQDHMHGEWLDPRTGVVLASFMVGPGPQKLAIPDFTVDLVLRIRAAGAASNAALHGTGRSDGGVATATGLHGLTHQ